MRRVVRSGLGVARSACRGLVCSWRPVALSALLLACQGERRDYSSSSVGSQTALGPASEGAATSPPPPGASAQAAVVPPKALSREEFAALLRAGSEKGEYFFSDNLVSNETAYQKRANVLTQLAVRGQAYLGVGPEQNFSFIGWVEPQVAFIVDIRRDNLLQHLWYKAMFELATSRSEYLCLWLGRRCDAQPGPEATIEAVIAAARAGDAGPRAFAEIGRRIDEQLASMGLELDRADQKRIARMRQAFHERGLALRFELHQATSHQYPTLERLLTERDDRGEPRGFLADEAAFRHVQELQRSNLVIPLVGDFAGEKALATVARELEARGLFVSLFYTSNVEQYLFEGDTWGRWVHNLGALPTDDRSLLARVHLDQGQPHPEQLAGHRSTLVLQRFEQFFAHQSNKPYRDAWELVTQDTLVLPE